MLKNVMVMGALACGAVAAEADVFVWDWKAGQGGVVNNAAGTYESVHAEFDSSANKFIWKVTFANAVTDALTLAVSNGPDPKGEPGELALLYIDATDPSSGNAKVSAYAYNGANSLTSWQDGNGKASGSQDPDLIHSIKDTSWITKAKVSNVAAKRVFELEFSTAAINAHDPKYPGSAPWKGIQFGPKLGLWMHSFDGAYPGFQYNTKGAISDFGFKNHGWFDGSNFPTVVPIPSAVLLGLGGLVGVALIRRRVTC
jgi:hypothetical protein